MLALIAAAFASPFVQRAYRSRIARLMRFNQISPRPSEWWASRAAAADPIGTNKQDQCETKVKEIALRDLVLQQEHRFTLSTIMAWLVFVLSAWLVAHWGYSEGSTSDQAYFTIMAGVLAFDPAYINLPRRFACRTLIFEIITFALAAALIADLTPPMPAVKVLSSVAEDPSDLESAITCVAISLSYVSLFHPRLRGLLLPVFVVVAVALMLMVIPYEYLKPYMGGACFEEATTTEQALGHWVQSTPFLIVSIAIVMLAVWFGFKALDALAHLLEAGWLSELSLIGAVSLVLITLLLVEAAWADQRAPSHWLAWSPLPWITAAVATYVLTLKRRVLASPGPRLLVLRVFARDRRQHKLLDQLQSQWRYVGPVHQIGGPDLATTNVELQACAIFLVGKLHDGRTA